MWHNSKCKFNIPDKQVFIFNWCVIRSERKSFDGKHEKRYELNWNRHFYFLSLLLQYERHQFYILENEVQELDWCKNFSLSSLSPSLSLSLSLSPLSLSLSLSPLDLDGVKSIRS